MAGAGEVDYRLHARLSFRMETDSIYTTFFGQSQNNFQSIRRGGAPLLSRALNGTPLLEDPSTRSDGKQEFSHRV
jgi:hypothetical protein